MTASTAAPAADCARCPRLAGFRAANRNAYPDFFNAPVPSFGALDARLLVLGLAPGLKGANRTGRPFTGDYAGDLLYATLLKFGLAEGEYRADPQDGLRLIDCRIANAVRCVPPENKPIGKEIAACRGFLEAEIAAMPRLRAIIALGRIAHDQAVKVLALGKDAPRFAHGAVAETGKGLLLAASYHCSRYNTNTGRLTAPMFEAVFAEVTRRLGAPAG